MPAMHDYDDAQNSTPAAGFNSSLPQLVPSPCPRK